MTQDRAAAQSAAAEKHHQHRNVSGGSARAAVFGISDGLVSNVAIVLGLAGAGPGASLVRLAGLAGLVGGAVSMAAGEYVSTTAHAELLHRELERERRELADRPELERQELVEVYVERGIDPDVAEAFVGELMKNPGLALHTHAREELGVDPGSIGSSAVIAVWSFFAFATGALVPLAPWFFLAGRSAVVASVLLTGVVALGIGVALGGFTGRSRISSALRQLAFTAVPAALTYVVGSAVGVASV